jgi:hypothetical protein
MAARHTRLSYHNDQFIRMLQAMVAGLDASNPNLDGKKRRHAILQSLRLQYSLGKTYSRRLTFLYTRSS